MIQDGSRTYWAEERTLLEFFLKRWGVNEPLKTRMFTQGAYSPPVQAASPFGEKYRR